MPEGLLIMKLLVFGDIHGLNVWKEIIKTEEYDAVIFLGDYFDSFDIGAVEQIENFREIMMFQELCDKPVITLLGNHDLHYLLPGEQYSGYQPLHSYDIREVIGEYVETLQMAFGHEDFLFTHAGVSKTWWFSEEYATAEEAAEEINDEPIGSFRFYKKDISGYGNDKRQGPTWIRPEALLGDMLPGVTQIVGHTRTPEIIIHENGLVQADSLWKGNYIIIDGKEIIPKHYEG